jgi:uncharacterized peroxidase-related enzyme
MSNAQRIHALNLPINEGSELDEDVQAAFEFLKSEHGLLPNVLKAYSFDQEKLRPFMQMYNNLMLAESALTTLEREMIAVVVSSVNRCVYCLTSHGAGVRNLSGDPVLGELLVMNYRVAELGPRQRAMLDFAVKVTEASYAVSEDDRSRLRDVGFDDRAIWDIAAVASFFNMTNRMSSALDIVPNKEYHFRDRSPPAP